MKLIKLTAIVAAVLGSSAAMAATTNAANYNVQPAYQYNPNAGIINNTTGAIAGTGKTLFNTVTHPGAISAEIGTLGYGANLSWGINKSTELQAGWSGADFDTDTDVGDDDSYINWDKVLGSDLEDFEGNLDVNADLSNPYLGVQMRPMNNWLTVGAGVMVPRNSFDAVLTSETGGTEITIDGQEYSIDDNTKVFLNAENKNKLAPYATLGFRPNINNKWGAFAEVGAAYMGKLKSNVAVDGNVQVLDSNGTVVATGASAINDFVERAENELADNDDIWYPIAKLGVTYRF